MRTELAEAILAFKTTPMARMALLALAMTPGPMTAKQVGNRARMSSQYANVALDTLNDFGLLEVSGHHPRAYALKLDALLNWKGA